MENTTPLKPFQRYVPLPNTNRPLMVEVMALESIFKEEAKMVLNAAISSLTDSNTTRTNTANVEAQEDQMHNRRKNAIKFYSTVIRQVFKMAFLPMIERARSDMQKLKKYHMEHGLSFEKILAIEEALKFNIVFQPPGVSLTFEEIGQLYGVGVFDAKQAYDAYYNKVGYTDPPLNPPPAFKEQMDQHYRPPPPEEGEGQNKKRPREEGPQDPNVKKKKKPKVDE